MTIQSSRSPTPVRVSSSSTRPSSRVRRGLLGTLLTPLVLIAAAVRPQQVRELAEAESVD